MNKTIEKKRTSAAKKVLKQAAEKYWYDHPCVGYKQLSENEIVLTNGFLVYFGSPIIDINRTLSPENFPDVERFIPNYGDKDIHELDVDQVKQNLNKAKAEWKGKRPKFKSLHKLSLDANTIVKNTIGDDVYFDSELVILCCNMIGGKTYTIQVRNVLEACIIRCEENDNFCLLMPLIKNVE